MKDGGRERERERQAETQAEGEAGSLRGALLGYISSVLGYGLSPPVGSAMDKELWGVRPPHPVAGFQVLKKVSFNLFSQK